MIIAVNRIAQYQWTRLETMGIFLIPLIIVGIVWFIRYMDKPSQRIFGYGGFRPELNHVTKRWEVPVGQVGNPGIPAGVIRFMEINGFLVMDAQFSKTISSAPLAVWVHEGTCKMQGKLRYTLASVVPGSSVWWTSLYEFPWSRLIAQQPLALTFREAQQPERILYCGDVQMNEDSE